MTVRLHWNTPDHDADGVFTLRGSPLFLVVSSSGGLDRFHQDPEDRDGFVVQEEKSGALRLESRGECSLDSAEGTLAPVQLPFDSTLTAACREFQWQFRAQGEVDIEDPLIGTELGGHRVVARLGNGSVGVVYRAVQLNLEREVALKVLDPKAARSSPLAVASFKREAVAAGRLSHPNLVQVYDVGQDRGLYFFSMELVAAGDLEDRIKENGPLPWKEALGYILDASEALHFAREHHLVHRDVKPENLMLTIDGRTKLADLGMATTRGMVEQAGAGGTPHFMAPECLSGEDVDFRSDFYSLGCTLFRLLTGSTPYQADSVREILRAHRDAPIPRLKDHQVEAPAAVQDLLEWLMAKHPDERPQDAQDILEEIHHLLDSKRSLGLILALSFVAVVAVGLSLFFALRPRPEVAPEHIIVEVEVESAAAQKERERLERELAFTNAMTADEGAERKLDLRRFLLAYPDSEFGARVEAELQRLADLPQAVTEDPPAEDPQAAERLVLEVLEREFLPLLEAQRFGTARQLLADATLPAEWMAPLWSRLETGSNSSFSVWETEHAEALAQEDWARADTLRRSFSSSLDGATYPPPDWAGRLSILKSSSIQARDQAARRDFRQARLALLQDMHDKVLPAMDRWQFRDAAEALRQSAEACPHPQLREALQQRVPLLLQAADLQEALFATLDGEVMTPMTEAIDGKRAFAIAAGPDGLRLQVQIRGERVERLDPWRLYESPEALPLLFDAILGEDQDLASRHSLEVLLAARSLARELVLWATAPAASEASALAQTCGQWKRLMQHAPFPPNSPGEEEGFAIQELAGLCSSLADGDSYSAYLHAQALQEHFSLLAAWSSDGSSTWGFRP